MGRRVRNRLFWTAGAGAVALALYLAFGYFGVQAAFTSNQVNEEFDPGSASAANAERDPDPTPQPESTEAATEPTMETAAAPDEGAAPEETPPSEAEEPTRAAQEPASEEAPEGNGGQEAEEAPEPAPEPAGPVAVASGAFHPVDHQGSGTATVYRLEDGSHVLRLEDLSVENGPDLYVYAIAAPDANDEAAALQAGFVNLGRLKGNVGNQTYELPAEYDPDVHRAISVWCQRFTSNFATAPLTS
jgi:hypothetical protein